MKTISIKKTSTCGSQELSKRLQRLFKLNDTNISQTAQKLGIPMMTIRRLISGETKDPRLSTLKLITDHFGITIDALFREDPVSIEATKNTKSYSVPFIDWETIAKISSIKDLNLDNWKEWQPISFDESEDQLLSNEAFAIESRPSMYPRFPQGSIFIIDPLVKPNDGDIILLKIKKNNEIALKELIIDPPEWKLYPIVSGSNSIQYSEESFYIIGVNMLTLLYKRKS